MTRHWFLITDLHGLLRTKLVTDPLHKTALSGIFVNDPFDRVIGMQSVDGRANVIIRADETSKRQSPYNSDETYVFCDALVEPLHEIGEPLPSKVCPRTQLQLAVDELRSLGYAVTCGMEMEWTLLEETTGDHLQSPLPQCATYVMYPMLYDKFEQYKDALFEATEKLSVPIEAFHVENGRGQIEASLAPSDPIRMADNVQLFRMVARREAHRCGWRATFASKVFDDAAGAGCHLHISLQHIADDDKDVPEITCGPFMAGILTHMNTMSSMYLPSTTSYERIGGRFWTMSNVSYGIDERSHAVRMVNYGRHSARIELRLPGADCNPYLVLLAALKSGIDGIKNNTKPPTNVGELGEPLPASLKEAVDLMEKRHGGDILGHDFAKHYIQVKRAECRFAPERHTGWKFVLY